MQKLTIFISVTKDHHVFNPEEYLCPLYIQSFLPTTSLDVLDLPRCTQQTREQAESDPSVALLHIPMETTEDVEDCKMYEIAVYSGPRAAQPE